MSRGYPQQVQVRGILGEKGRRGQMGSEGYIEKEGSGGGGGKGAVKVGVDHLPGEIHQVQDCDLVISPPGKPFLKTVSQNK